MQASTTISVLFPIRLHEAGRDLGENRLITQCVAANIGFRHAREVLRADQSDVTLRGEGLNEIAGVGALHGARSRKHRNEARTGALGRRLDGRNGATKVIWG